MMAAADTFGFGGGDAGEKEGEDTGSSGASTAPTKPDLFEAFDQDSGSDGYAKFAAKLSSKLLELQGNHHYLLLVTELAKNLCTAMSIEEIAEVVAAMEVVKNAKRVQDKGGNKKKGKKPAVSKAQKSAAREDTVYDEYDNFL